MKGIQPADKIPKPTKHETLCRDDFIEWILHNTNEDCEFRVHKAKNYVLVGIDNLPLKEE